MLNCTISPGVRKLADRTKHLVSGRMSAFNNLCGFITLYLFNLASMSELTRIAPWTFSVSDLDRAISGFDGNRFMRRLRKSILRRYGKEALSSTDFVLAIDDTDNPRFGKGVHQVGKWHGSKGVYFGQKVQVLVLVDIVRGFAIPLSYRFGLKKDDPNYISGIDLAYEQIQEVVQAGLPVKVVVADSWFDSVDLMKKITALGLTFVVEVKSNRRVKQNPGPQVKWSSLRDIFSIGSRRRLYSRLDSQKIKKRIKRAKCGLTKRIMIKKYPRMLNALAVYNRRNSKNAFAYYVSTDLKMTGARIWEISRARWKIECMFRDLKQNLSFGRLPCQGKEASDLAVCMPFTIYTSLLLDGPTYWGLTENESVGTMLKRIREREFERSIKVILENPNHQKVKRLKARRSCINRKPVNHSTAGKAKTSACLAA